ncbi:MAG: deoxynucleoside kinase [Pseudomonadota bacterium]
MSSEPAFIAVEGPIGVGKTALAERLAERLNAGLVLESQADNPFLERFYRDRKGSALPAQLFFLFERARQVEALRQDDLFSSLRIADFLLERDRLFAELNLDPEELSLYEQIRARLGIDPPQPDLVVYLQAPVDVLAERIARRGIEHERHIERDYLEQVAERYASFFHDYDAAPLLIVNVAAIDPIHNDVEFEALLERVKSTRRGRHFYNPIAAFG